MSTKDRVMYAERHFIDAEMSRKLLRKVIANNRPISERRKKELERDIRNSHWQENGDTIRCTGPSLEDPGEVIDGQHRLQASAETGIGFWTLIAFNIKREAFTTIDTGQSRSRGQILHLVDGVHDYNAIAGTIGWLYRFREGIMTNSGRPTTSESQEILMENPGIPEAVMMARSVLRRFKAGPIAVVAACYYLFTRQDATLAELFFDELATGASLREQDPVYQLRQRILISHTSTARRIDSYELFALYFKVWNATREQTTMKVLRWSQPEGFPNIGSITTFKKRPEKIDKNKSNTLGKRPKRKPIINPEPIPDTTSKKEVEPPQPPLSKLDQLILKQRGLDKR